MFISYIDLLNAVDHDGEVIYPSNVSTNRSFETKELNNVQLELTEFKLYLLNDEEVEYYKKELQWYFDTYEKPAHKIIENNHEKWSEYPVYKSDTFLKDLREMAENIIQCKNRCGANSNYGEMTLRLKNHIGITQFDWVVEKLKKDKSTRLAIAFYNTPNYQYWSNDDFVCCLTLMFTIKNNKLNTTINSRSNDLINGFRFDMIWWRIFLKKVHDALLETYPDLKLGSMFFNIFSAHFYLKDNEKLQKIREAANNNSFSKNSII